jgi:hypothetical protein
MVEQENEQFRDHPTDNGTVSDLALGSIVNNSVMGMRHALETISAMQFPGAVQSLIQPLQIFGGPGESPEAQLNRHAEQAPVPPRTLQNDLPPAQIHAPQLRGAQETSINTTVSGDTTTIGRVYSTGHQLIQHVSGPLAGAEVLMNSNGAVISMLEASHAQGPGRPRLQIDVDYAQPPLPGQQAMPSGVTMRNATTGEILGQRSGEGPGSIIVTAEQCQVTQGAVTDTMNLDGTHSSVDSEHALTSLQFVPRTDVRTPEGHVFPAGSIVTHRSERGRRNFSATSVVTANGEVEQTYVDRNGRMIQTGENYRRPRTVEHTVSGTTQRFPNITSQYIDEAAGTRIMQGSGEAITLTWRNGEYVDIHKRMTNKAFDTGLELPRPILLNLHNLRNVARVP